MISNGSSNAADAKDAHILVLDAKIKELEHNRKKEEVVLSTNVTVRPNMIAEWRSTNSGPTMIKEDKDWWWCPKHRNKKVLRARHKPEEHGKRFQLQKKEEIEAATGTTSNDKPNANMKLALSSSIKTDIFTMGMLTEE